MTTSTGKNTTGTSSAKASRGVLSDFTTDWRVLLLCALAVPIGAIAALVAKRLEPNQETGRMSGVPGFAEVAAQLGRRDGAVTTVIVPALTVIIF